MHATDQTIASTDKATDATERLTDDVHALRHQLEPYAYLYGDPHGPADDRHGVLIRATYHDRKGPHLLVSFTRLTLPRTSDTARGYAEVTEDPYRPGEHRIRLEYVARVDADGKTCQDSGYNLIPLTDKMREALREELAAHLKVYLAGIDSLAGEHRKAHASHQLEQASRGLDSAHHALTEARRILAGQA